MSKRKKPQLSGKKGPGRIERNLKPRPPEMTDS